ncbi:MAG: protein kinase [Acidobacteriota bacterium]|nr:MAG: protein kinase [Acidobacteriota bacterium]
MTLAPGTRIGPYEVVELLGKGGMGEVYRASDPRLGRYVAVKVLPVVKPVGPDSASRFEREARLLASINHPNIATIHGLEDLRGSSAIVMELVDGPSLADLIARGPVSVAEVVRIASQIADGMSSAHERGIIHRDLKPSNVRITSDCRVKILDLGLAKIVTTAPQSVPDDEVMEDAETVAMETRAGTVVGTPAYMSPEQAVGMAVDSRSDVWAFGALLFELLSGRRAFSGKTIPEILASVLRGVVDWEVLPADVPHEVRVLIERCLECDVSSRLSSFGEAREILLSLPDRPSPAVAGAGADSKSIVVLPFANLSPDPDTEYFSDGLTDEIITDLSRVRALRVISRSSAMRLKGDTRDLAAISRELSCRYVLEGSVRRAANSLRITARLVDALKDVQLWADKFGGTLDDVFDIQERVSRSIVDALEIRLTPQEAQQLAERPIADVRAQECYLRARSEVWSFLPAGPDRAISHLEAALGLIGENVLLYRGLGEAYFQSVNLGVAGGTEEEHIAKAEWCAERIFALEPDSPHGYLVSAPTQLARGDIHGCARSLRRGLKAFPKDVLALQLYTHVLGWLTGKPEAAAPFAARLLEVDPLNAMSLLVIAMVPLFAGRFSEAVAPARRMFDLDPVSPIWRANYAMVLSYAQRLDEAEELTAGVTAQPDSDIGTWWMGLCRATWRADRAEVVRLTDGPYRRAAEWDAEIPWVLADAHSAVGAKEEALFWLDRAIDRGMINYPFLSEYDIYLDNIREDVRFRQAMARARREWERLDA